MMPIEGVEEVRPKHYLNRFAHREVLEDREILVGEPTRTGTGQNADVAEGERRGRLESIDIQKRPLARIVDIDIAAIQVRPDRYWAGCQ